MSTRVHTIVRTRTEVYVSGKLAYAMQVILSELGLGSAAYGADWDDVEHAMYVWMSEESLKTVTLEVYDRRSDALIATFDMDIIYAAGQASMRHDAELARLAARKVALHASGSLGFRVLMSHHGYHTPVDGWVSTTARDASTLRRRTIGELARGPGISSELSYRL